MDNIFKGTELQYRELTEWILKTFKKYKITDIRFFGSRMYGTPRSDSDIDVYLLFDGKHPDRPPIFTELYKGYQIEFHPFMDFHDDFVPTWLIGTETKNELKINI